MRILLVEDDELFGEGLYSGLTQYQYVVDWVKDGFSALSVIQSEVFDLIILDLNLPKIPGDEILRNMREKNILTPVLILTAYDAVSHRVLALDSGIDDYIIKPFNLEELCARIRAIHRRTKLRTNSRIVAGDISLDPVTRLVFKDGEMIELSPREFTLLQTLLENVGKILTREQIEQSLYSQNNNDAAADNNLLELDIHNLRKKLKCKNINTIRGVGYRFKLIPRIV